MPSAATPCDGSHVQEKLELRQRHFQAIVVKSLRRNWLFRCETHGNRLLIKIDTDQALCEEGVHICMALASRGNGFTTTGIQPLAMQNMLSAGDC